MFTLKTKNVKMLQDTINAYAVLIDEATLHLTPDAITIKAMDNSRVAMIYSSLPKELFNEYTCTETQKIGLNLSELIKLLKRAGKEDNIELSLDPKTGRLHVTITGKATRNFSMPTLESSEEEVPTPKLTFKNKMKITTSAFSQAVEDAQLVSDHVQITVTKEGVALHAVGDLMNADITLQKGSDNLLDLETSEDAKATYSLSYLTELLKTAGAISEIVVAELNTDMPIKLDFLQQTGYLTFYLAPRIETE